MVLLSNSCGIILAVTTFCCLLLTKATGLPQNETEIYDNFNSTTSLKINSCEESKDFSSCSGGSRFYRLLSYEVDNSQILPQCFAVCNDTYSSGMKIQACGEGCLIEVKVAKQSQNELDQFAKESSSLIHRAMQQQMLSHWMFSMISGFDLFNEWYESDNSYESDGDFSTYLVVEQSDSQLRISSYKVANRPGSAATTTSHDSGPMNPYADSKEEDFESCYTKSTYSRLVLCLLLFSSALFLVWLTCSTVTTAPRQPVQSEKEKETVDEKNSFKLKLPLDDSPVLVHLPHKSNDDDEKMLLA